MTHLTQFLSHPGEPNMSKDECSFSGRLHQQNWRLKLSQVGWAHYYSARNQLITILTLIISSRPTKSCRYSCNLLYWLPPCKISKISFDFFYRYLWSMNLPIWLDESTLAYNLWARIFPNLGIWKIWKIAMSFISKSSYKIFWKLKKTVFFFSIWAFSAHFRKNVNFLKKLGCHFWNHLVL